MKADWKRMLENLNIIERYVVDTESYFREAEDHQINSSKVYNAIAEIRDFADTEYTKDDFEEWVNAYIYEHGDATVIKL